MTMNIECMCFTYWCFSVLHATSIFTSLVYKVEIEAHKRYLLFYTLFFQTWPQNVQYSQTSNFQYIQPFIQHSSPQNRVRSAFYVPVLSGRHVFSVNQQYGEMTNSTSNTQYVLKNAVDMNDMLARRIRDIIIDILSTPVYKVGICFLI